ncbi:MAG: hypothetical protein HY686_07165 [Chloroflexi bacterium]|nr:hypothetical protein [Chloroflexota bacterium]
MSTPLNPLVMRLEQELETRYREALLYCLRHNSGWEEAAQAYHQLCVLKEDLARRAAEDKGALSRAA